MISIKKKGNEYVMEVEYKKPLEDLKLTFTTYKALMSWIKKEIELKRIDFGKPKTPLELDF